MPDCLLRPATAVDAQIVYALICELKQAEFDNQAFHAGFLANLQDHSMHYQLAELDGQVIGMIGLHMQFHLHHARWIGEIQELVMMPQARSSGCHNNGAVKPQATCKLPNKSLGDASL